jgi:hypothetical protein
MLLTDSLEQKLNALARSPPSVTFVGGGPDESTFAVVASTVSPNNRWEWEGVSKSYCMLIKISLKRPTYLEQNRCPVVWIGPDRLERPVAKKTWKEREEK